MLIYDFGQVVWTLLSLVKSTEMSVEINKQVKILFSPRQKELHQCLDFPWRVPESNYWSSKENMHMTPDPSTTTSTISCPQTRASQKWRWKSPPQEALQWCPQVQLLLYMRGLMDLVPHPHHYGFKLWYQSIKSHIKNQPLQTCICFLRIKERMEAGMKEEAMWAFSGCLCSCDNTRKEERLRFKVDIWHPCQ